MLPRPVQDTLLPSLQAHFKKTEQPELEKTAWLIQQLNKARQLNFTHRDMIQILLPLPDLARRKGWPDVEAELWLHIGQLHFSMEAFAPAFEYILKAVERFAQVGYGPRGHLYRHLPTIARNYYTLADWESTLRYLHLYHQVPAPVNPMHNRYLYLNTMAMAHKQLQQYDSALHWFDLAEANAATAGNTFWTALVRGNIGHTYYLQGQYAAALPLLQQDYAASREAGEYQSMLQAGLILAHLHVLLALPLQEASAILQTVEPHLHTLASEANWGLWYQVQYLYARKLGIPSGTWADSALYHQQAAARQRNQELLVNVRRQVEIKQYLQKISLAEADKRQQIILRNSMMAGIVLMAGMALLLVNRARLAKAKKLQAMAYEHQLAAQQVQQLEAQLAAYTDRMRHHSSLVATISAELESMQHTQTLDTERKAGLLGKLQQATILTEDEWQHFRVLFDQVHPGYILQLRERLPGLTPAEVRLLVLSRLQLNPREMAAMLGIGTEAIKKTKQRLRKKLLQNGIHDLDTLVQPEEANPA